MGEQEMPLVNPAMTSRQRWRAALKSQPVDRLPFWPKINGAYFPHQRSPFRDYTVPQLHRWLGSDPCLGVGDGLRAVRSATRLEEKRGATSLQARFVTPRGTLTMVHLLDAASGSWHPVEFPVKSREDIETLRLWYEDCRPEIDPAGQEQVVRRVQEIGETAVTQATVGVSPLMDWLQHLAGIELGHFLLADVPEEVEGLFAAMHRVLLQRAELLAAHSPADTIWCSENTSTTLISPAQYEQYCLPHVSEYGRIVRAAGKIFVIHMCGYLKGLLPLLATVPADAFEAFTSPPVGNTRLIDGRSACPAVCLVGGTNATLWLRPAPQIIAEIDRDLAALPHWRGVVMSSAGVMPPACSPETIRTVCDHVHGIPFRG